MIDPKQVLIDGSMVLQPVVEPHGFRFVLEKQGEGSGGYFASGSFFRGERRLELHFRDGLGEVEYHIGECRLRHSEFMRVHPQVNGDNQYPRPSSDDRLAGFRGLAEDLRRFGGDFLNGDGDFFRECALQAARNPKRSGFKALR